MIHDELWDCQWYYIFLELTIIPRDGVANDDFFLHTALFTVRFSYRVERMKVQLGEHGRLAISMLPKSGQYFPNDLMDDSTSNV